MKTYAVFDNSFFKQKPWWLPHKLYNVVCYRSNPRAKDYMINLLQQEFPDAELININSPLQQGRLILLYPDAIGLGWRELENKYMKIFNDISVLNGRKRYFSLKKMNRAKILLKRFLEVTFLPEIILAPFIVFYGIVLAINDKISGRS